MALYVVVHHQRDSEQPWVNAWDTDDLLTAIMTTPEIGERCRKAKSNGELVYVHRCGWGEYEPVICCSAEVEAVNPADKKTALVQFKNQQRRTDVPRYKPIPHQNSYELAAVE